MEEEMTKKITFFHPYFIYGGVEKTNIRLAKYFVEHGYLVEFMALSFSDHLKDEMDAIGITRVSLKAKRTMNAVGEIRKYMVNESKKYQLTFISCQNYANLAAIFARPAKCNNLKLIISERSNPTEFQYGSSSVWKGKLILFLMKHFYKKADVILANSRETAEMITGIAGKKAEYIYNPTLSEPFDEMAEEPVEFPWQGNDIPTTIAVGRLVASKGYRDLLEAFTLMRKHIKANLLILGEGEQRAELEQIIQKNGITESVWLPGYDSNPYKYMAKASLFVMTSYYEGLPNVLIEACALKIPCVSTRCKSGPKEILSEGKGGYLVELGNITELANTMEYALTHQEETAAKAAYAYKHLNRFTPQEVGKKYLEVIEA